MEHSICSWWCSKATHLWISHYRPVMFSRSTKLLWTFLTASTVQSALRGHWPGPQQSTSRWPWPCVWGCWGSSGGSCQGTPAGGTAVRWSPGWWRRWTGRWWHAPLGRCRGSPSCLAGTRHIPHSGMGQPSQRGPESRRDGQRPEAEVSKQEMEGEANRKIRWNIETTGARAILLTASMRVSCSATACAVKSMKWWDTSSVALSSLVRSPDASSWVAAQGSAAVASVLLCLSVYNNQTSKHSNINHYK